MTFVAVNKHDQFYHDFYEETISSYHFYSIISLWVFTNTKNRFSKEVIERLDGKTNALDERVLVNEADLGKLNKIKVSGYIQAECRDYESALVKTNDPYNTFFIRRARIKFTYEATDGVKFVLQPDFSTGNLALKDAYAVVNIPKLKGLDIMGRSDEQTKL